MSYTVTLIPGDGSGPEVTAATRGVISASGGKITWDEQDGGAAAAEKYGNPCPDELLQSVQRNRIALKGPIGTPIGKGFRSVNVTLRKTLDLYACLRPVKNIPGVKSRYENVDLVIVRENTEGLYTGLEHLVVPGVAESIKVVTEAASNRIAEFAFRHARANRRRKVSIIHKANIMKISDGLFLDTARRMSKKFSDIETNEVIVDACA